MELLGRHLHLFHARVVHDLSLGVRLAPWRVTCKQPLLSGSTVNTEFEGRFYALSASKAIFRARSYSRNLFSPAMMIT